MTQLDPHPPKVRRGRTWRDLPATPPLEDTADTAPKDARPAPEPNIEQPAPPESPKRRSGLLIYASLATLLVAVMGGFWLIRDGATPATTPTVAPAEAEAGSPAAVAAALTPAVVHIEVLGGLGSGGGVGSGVIYDTSGLVLTAHHVVSFSDEVAVTTADGQTVNGRVVGRLPERDLAVVALERADSLVAATIAEPGTLEVGEPAIALGSPFGFQLSVTAGIISGLDRELQTPVGLLTGLIQTDAPINPGNSGGPLADAEAKVIGINTAIASMSGGNDGVGFAVPVEHFTELIDQVESNGGVDAPTMPAPEQAPGFDLLIPGLEDLLPGLDELFRLDDPQSLRGLPELEEMLEELFGQSDMPPDLQRLFEDLLIPGLPDQGGGS